MEMEIEKSLFNLNNIYAEGTKTVNNKNEKTYWLIIISIVVLLSFISLLLISGIGNI